MKFLSIFSARRDADGKTRMESTDGRLGVEEAVRLFGVSEAELTPSIRAAFGAMSGEITDLRRQIEGLRKNLDEAESMADHDPLVPLFNRRAFMRELSRLLSFARRYGLEASLIYFDLDGFKAVNDKHGHAAGDKLLCAVSETLTQHTRESDILGRLGGDEFVAVLTSVDPETGRQKAEQLASSIREIEVTFEGATFGVGVSYGIADLNPEVTPDDHVARADEAMYADKVRRKSGG